MLEVQRIPAIVQITLLREIVKCPVASPHGIDESSILISAIIIDTSLSIANGRMCVVRYFKDRGDRRPDCRAISWRVHKVVFKQRLQTDIGAFSGEIFSPPGYNCMS